MEKVDIIKELLKDIKPYEQKQIANLILDDSIFEANKERQNNCQVCRARKATVDEGISKLRQCGECYHKLWGA